MLQSINPYTQKVLQQFPEHTQVELDEIVEKSATAFQLWKHKTYTERAELFYKLGTLLISNKEEYGKLITAEMGKPLKEAIAEIEKCASAVRYYADQAENFLKPTLLKTEAEESYIVYEPFGTILALMPWNFPFWQVIRCAVPAMMAGNTVLLKLAPNTIGCAVAIESIFEKAGFPEGCFLSLKIQNETTSYLIQKKEVKAISLTGSERAGVIVASEAGKYLKKTVLELGGSDPFIVLGDADLNYTVEQAVKARLQNAGQSCIAAKRFILVKSISEKFISALTEKLKLLKIGDPMNPSTDLGPMARADLKVGLIAQVKKSIAAGAKLVYGSLNETSDNFFSPIILSNVKPKMPAYEEELFGPVFSIIEVESEEEAIRVANDSNYGLGSSVWTKDIEKAKILATQIESGMVFINNFVHSDIRLPFGGVKLSGYGRELSELGMKEFVNAKLVYVRG
jgi:succinate-semialdehyde dehydrogenase/glutarate-semialdehyde dehydrogenase